MKKKELRKKSLGVLLGAVALFGVIGCANQTSRSEITQVETEQEVETEENKTILYGKSQGPYTELFETAIIPILESSSYTFEAVEFADLLTADIALNDGEVDFNVEQHQAYVDNFNQNYSANLKTISTIPTVPAGLYSAKYTKLDEIKDGAIIAVPDDASNTARAYVLLQKAGWIVLNSEVEPANVTQDDIVENPYNLVFVEQKSLTIPAAMPDYDFVVITGSIVYNAGIDPASAILTEDILEHLLLQVVVKEENVNTEWAKAIVDAYHSEKFKTYIEENNNGLWYVPY